MTVTRELWNNSKDAAAYDMHVHTTMSDALITPKQLAKVLKKKGISCAVTDHNIIKSVRKVLDYHPVIPGIEVSAAEGPHILIYFDRYSALEEYFNTHIRGRHTMCPHLAIRAGTLEIIDGARDAGGVVVAAHPYGYGIAVRGVMKGINTGILPPETADHLDGLEALCTGLTRPFNDAAETYAADHGLAITGGSDAHIPWDVGTAVTLGPAGAGAEEMLEALRKRQTEVYGCERGIISKCVQGIGMTPRYIPWLPPLIGTHMQQHILRLQTFFKKRA